jgi:hypothetical protein
MDIAVASMQAAVALEEQQCSGAQQSKLFELVH